MAQYKKEAPIVDPESSRELGRLEIRLSVGELESEWDPWTIHKEAMRMMDEYDRYIYHELRRDARCKFGTAH